MDSFFGKIRFIFRLFHAFLLVVLRTELLRRKLMMIITIAALLMLFFGYAIIDRFLERHPLIFSGYWIFCMTLVALMLLLGVYDIIRLRRGQTSLLDDLKSVVPEDKFREISELLEQQHQQHQEDDKGARPGPRGERRVTGSVKDVDPDETSDDGGKS